MRTDTNINDALIQALANVRLESLEISDQMKEMIKEFILNESMTTSDMIERKIKDQSPRELQALQKVIILSGCYIA